METEMLENRISILENLVYGSQPPQPSQYNGLYVNEYQKDIQQRYHEISVKVESLINSIPALKTSSELVSKIGPILFRQQFSVAQTEAKVLNLLSIKNQLTETVNQLTEISRLEPAVNKPFLDDIPKYVKQIQELEGQISVLQSKIMNQSAEIDQFLNIYHQAMEIVIHEIERIDQETSKM